MSSLSLGQAAQRTGKSRRTIGRMLADGKIAGAELKDGVWSIPIESLAVAGLLDEKPKEKPKEVEDVADDSQPLTWKERALVAEARLEQVEKDNVKLDAMIEENQKAMEALRLVLFSRSAIEATQSDNSDTVQQAARRRWFGRK